MHRGCEGGKRDTERRHAGLILKRDQRDPLFPVPAPEQVDRAPAETTLAVVNERRARPVSAHRTPARPHRRRDRKSTRLNSSHGYISYAVFCLKKKKTQ